jgi:hypothetical protein
LILYELVNPSDPYSFFAISDKVAAAVGIVLGEGAYAVRRHDNSERILPTLRFIHPANQGEFMRETFPEGLEPFLLGSSQEIAGALDSVACISPAERADYEMCVARLASDELRQGSKLRIHDKNRSSLNDIGRRAWKMAEYFRTNFGPKV